MTENLTPTIPPPPPGTEDNYVCESCGLVSPVMRLRCPHCRTMPTILRRDYRLSYILGFATWIPDALFLIYFIWDDITRYRQPELITPLFRISVYSTIIACWLILAWFSTNAYIRISRRIKRWWWL
jgi:hypothetical protein